MVTNLLNLIFGSKNDREIKRLRPIVDRINEFESSLIPLSDLALTDKTQDFRKRLEAGEPLDDLLPEAFAVCREAATPRSCSIPISTRRINGCSTCDPARVMKPTGPTLPTGPTTSSALIICGTT